MRKVVDNDYIIALTTANIGTEITETEYDTIMKKIQNKPNDPEGYSYMLLSDTLEWELVKLPEPIDEEVGPEDYEQALQQMGVEFND